MSHEPFTYVDPSVIAIAPSVVAAMPAAFAREENVMPIKIVGRSLIVAVECPEDSELIEKLQFVCNRPIEPVMAEPNAIRCAVAKHYGDAG